MKAKEQASSKRAHENSQLQGDYRMCVWWHKKVWQSPMHGSGSPNGRAANSGVPHQEVHGALPPRLRNANQPSTHLLSLNISSRATLKGVASISRSRSSLAWVPGAAGRTGCRQLVRSQQGSPPGVWQKEQAAVQCAAQVNRGCIRSQHTYSSRRPLIW